ncbi:MAG: flavodoxin-dependent (E)-4-hydroxy-3-methylbut-2-enyl-diphosphate synthase [Clostridia bacterium]|nr:flavodoxin-dependent (E)-4-hydroxy-3-methylbut-2-enyl-diphosphate synthase [Clostridia bacterium]
MTRRVLVGDIPIGGGAAVSVQSMLTVPLQRREECLAQARQLQDAGCEIIRAAVPDDSAAQCLPFLIKNQKMPVVADIHFDYRTALCAIRAGAAKLRINPGNIGGPQRVKAVAAEAKLAGIPIRVGVNGGSLEKELLAKHGGPTAEALAESALGHIAMLRDFGLEDIVVSIKSSNIPTMTRACRILAARTDCPQHIGVTEAGTLTTGLIANAMGIGILLNEGIGDTIRVSLSADPIHEVRGGLRLLRLLGLRQGPRVIACPTCARCNIDVQGWALRVENALESTQKNITVAVMGCAVNGPGEAREADIGLAGGDGCALLFERGEIVCKLNADEAIDVLLKRIGEMQDASTMA